MPAANELRIWPIASPLGFAALLVLSLPLRIFASVEPRMYRILILLVGYALGLAAQQLLFSSLAPGRVKSWMRRWAVLCLGAWLALWLLHALWLQHGEGWPHIYVVAGERTEECKCTDFTGDARCGDAVRSDNRCIYCLSFNAADIRQCWSEQRIKLAAVVLAIGYAFFGGCFGSVIGLFLLPAPPIRVFVSYRRKDSANLVVGPLATALRGQFDDRAFIDEHAIKGGTKWRLRIRLNAETCDAFVVVIGPLWLETFKARTAAGEEDWVKYELETAIKRGVTLVPLLFGGAAMPAKQDLRGKLRELAETQAVVVAEGIFDLGGEPVKILDQEAFDQAMNELMTCILKARRLRSDS